MDQLRRVLTTIKDQLSRLTVSQKLLLGSLGVLMLMTLFVVSRYAGGQEMVELFRGATPEQNDQAAAFVRAAGIEHKVRNGSLLVPADRKYFVLGQMSQQGALPGDTTLLFNNLTEKTTWTMSSEQARRLGTIALQNELAMVISNFSGVRSAKVFIDAPEGAGGLGRAARTPTATATIFTQAGRALDQQTVDAVAHLIAGAKSGMNVNEVRVIDGTTNRQHRARGDDDVIAGTYLEHATKVETRVRDKLLDMLGYIEGVVVAVNAQVDVRQRRTEHQRVLPSGEGTETAPLRESTTERRELGAARGAEAGVRSNTGLDINRGGTGQSTFSENQSETEFTTQFGKTFEQIVDPRGMPTKINATINIPRSYFVRAWRLTQGAEAQKDAQPAEADLALVVEAETRRIEGTVQPIIETAADDETTAGAVVVSMIPDAPVVEARGGFGSAIFGGGGSSGGGGLMAGGGGVTVLAGGLIKTVALLGLAAVALAMMAMALKRASKPMELPTAEELVGVPPALSRGDDTVGEADEAEAPLAGIEINDVELQLRKKVEQVSTLVKEKPSEAARLLNRWIAAEE